MMQDRSDALSFKTIGLVQMARNAIPASFFKVAKKPTPEMPQSVNNLYFRYYLFDYFDSLIFAGTRQLEGALNPAGHPLYQFHFGFENPIERFCVAPQISQQILTLVSDDQDIEKAAEIFQYTDKTDSIFSEQPFLILISVACVHATVSTSESNSNLLRNELEKHLKESLAPNADKYKIFFSATSGDYCIAIRTNDINRAYNVAWRLRSCREPMKIHTFSTVGIACPPDMWIKPEQLVNELETHINGTGNLARCNFVVRLHIRSFETVQRLTAAVSGSPLNCDYNGLYGRYDVSINISFEQFWILYPLFSFAKFNVQEDKPLLDHPALKAFIEKYKHSDALVQVLYDCVLNNEIDLINERPLINAMRKCEKDEKDDDTQKIKFCCLLTDRMKLEMDSLIARSNIVVHFHEKFKDYLEQLNDIRMCYQNMQYEPDSELNGLLFFAHFELICFSVHEYLNTIQKHTASKDYAISKKICSDLTTFLLKAIESLNSFNKLVQSRNLQSLQSPNFEMQMSIDMEKYLIAYSEFLQEFTAKHYCFFSDPYRNNIKPIRTIPVFSIDRAHRGVRNTILFPNPRENYRKPLMESMECLGDSDIPIYSSTTAPSTHSFARIQETLPKMLHEISHQFRFVDSKERNTALAEYLLCCISERFSQYWVCYLQDNYPSVLMDYYQQAIAEELHAQLKTGLNSVLKQIPEILSFRLDTFKDILVEYLTIAAFNSFSEPYVLSNIQDVIENYRQKIFNLYNLGYNVMDEETQKKYLKLLVPLQKNGIKRSDTFELKALSYFAEGDVLADLLSNGYLAICSQFIEDFRRLKASLSEDENERKHIRDIIFSEDIILDKIRLSDNLNIMLQLIEEEYNKTLQNLYKDTIFKKIPSQGQYILKETIAGFYRDLLNLSYATIAYKGAVEQWKSVSSSYFLFDVHQIDCQRLLESATAHLKTMVKDKAVTIGSAPYQQALGSARRYSMMRESFQQCMQAYGDSLQSNVEDYVEIYREVFADLCMCAALDFTPTAYLWFVAQNDLLSFETLSDIKKTTRFERINSVVRTILKAPTGDSEGKTEYRCCCEQLIPEAEAIVIKHCKHIIGNYQEYGMCSADAFKSLQESFIGQLRDILSNDSCGNAISYTNINELQNKCIKFISKLDTSANSQRLVDEVQILCRFVIIVVNSLSLRLFTSKPSYVIQSHYNEIYWNHIRGESGCIWEASMDDKEVAIRKKIGDYYKKGTPSSDMSELNELFDINTNFTIHYYEKNRKRLLNLRSGLEQALQSDNTDVQLRKWLCNFSTEGFENDGT